MRMQELMKRRVETVSAKTPANDARMRMRVGCIHEPSAKDAVTGRDRASAVLFVRQSREACADPRDGLRSCQAFHSGRRSVQFLLHGESMAPPSRIRA